MKINRRIFIKNTATKITGMAVIPAVVSAAMPEMKKVGSDFIKTLNINDTVLFQGDSITDAGRNKQIKTAGTSSAFGTGYAFLAASELLNNFPGKDLKLFNRGISGNKVYQLIDRWQEDCLELKPALLSILIGVNDFWHGVNNRYTGTVEKYESDYRKLLQTTRNELPGVKLVLCEPFAVKGGSAITDKWYPGFADYQKAAKKLAVEFNAVFIPYQKLFDEALKYAPAAYWAPDGVHPSMAGASLMAKAWLKAVNGAR